MTAALDGEIGVYRITDKETAVILRSAANKLEAHGWIQGSHGDEIRGYCTIGAIDNSVDHDKYHLCFPVTQVFNNWLNAIDATQTSVVDWNDHPSRTKEEVILYLRKCADELHPEPQ